ncbi:capsid protein [Crucivirus-387]|nr:capsid protein [Crucivirus-387]
MPKRRATSRTRRRVSAPKRRVRASTFRRPAPYRGRGAYSAPKTAARGTEIGRGIGSLLSYSPKTAAFAPVASALLGKIGGWAGDKIGKYMGWGSYTVRQNSLMVPEGQSPAQMHTSGNYVRVSHREYIGDIYAPGDGSTTYQTFQVNPGNISVFPWLQMQAMSYQKYKILGAIWEFKSTTGNFSTAAGANPNVGEVIMSTNYNCADPPFTSRSAMENTQYCNSSKPSTSFVHIVECDPSLQAQENLYIAEGGVPRALMSINEANWCQTTISTQSTQTATGKFQLGSLYLTYDILLIQPIDRSAFVTPTFAGNVGAGVVPGYPLGDTRVLLANPQNSVKVVLGGFNGDGNNYNTITFPELTQGVYYINCVSSTASAAAAYTAPAYSTFTNCAVAVDVDANNLALNYAAPSNGALTQLWSCAVAIRITGTGIPSLRFGGGAFQSNGVTRIIITQIDQDLLGAMP